MKDRIFSVIQILGLALGLSVCFVIVQYAQIEKGYDEFYADSENIYRVTTRKIQNGIPQEEKSSASVCLASYLRDHNPGIIEVTRVHKFDPGRITVSFQDESGDRVVFNETRAYHAEPNFFGVFDTKFIKGDPATSLQNPNEVVLTASIARKYFGDENPIGRILTIVDDMEMEYKVVAVVSDTPLNTHFAYDILVSDATFVKQHPNWRWHAWNWDYFHTYFRTGATIDKDQFQLQLNQEIALAGKEQFEAGNYEMQFNLQPLIDIHLHSDLGNEFTINGDAEMVKYLLLIGWIVLILAWVNYVSMSSARSTLRARDIGIRKVVGANRGILVFQLLVESLIINAVALLMAFALIIFIHPYLDLVLGYSMPLNLLGSIEFWSVAVLVVVLGSVLSGLYPALMITSLKTIQVLRGHFRSSTRGLALRKGLITFQFAVTLLLISCSIMIYSQVDFLRQRDMGFRSEQVLVVYMDRVGEIQNFWQKYDVFKRNVEREPGIEYVTASGAIPGMYLNHEERFKMDFENEDDADFLKMFAVDYGMVELYELNLLSGRDFHQSRQSENYEVILNESAAMTLGFSSPSEAVDQPISWVHSYGGISECQVVGVVENHDQQALSGSEASVFFLNRPFERWNGMEYISVRVNSQEYQALLNTIEDHFTSVFAGGHFTYFFLDEKFDQSYHREVRFGHVFSTFSFIGLSISIIGLLALSSFILGQRKKEISIRKVMGANITSLVQLFSFQYLRQIILATVISMPLTYLSMNRWLESHPYKIDLDWVSYLLPFAIVTILILVLIGLQTMKTAQINPTENLRDE